MPAKIIPMPDPTPEEYRLKRVIAAEPHSGGFTVRYECGHEVWTAIAVQIGDRRYCAVCVNGLTDRLRNTPYSVG